jgi:hypothetical protein
MEEIERGVELISIYRTPVKRIIIPLKPPNLKLERKRQLPDLYITILKKSIIRRLEY